MRIEHESVKLFQENGLKCFRKKMRGSLIGRIKVQIF